MKKSRTCVGMQCSGVVKVMPTGLPKQIYSVQVIGFNLSLYNPFFQRLSYAREPCKGRSLPLLQALF